MTYVRNGFLDELEKLAERRRSSKKKRAAGIGAGAISGAAVGIPVGLLGALAYMATRGKIRRNIHPPKGILKQLRYIRKGGLARDAKKIGDEAKRKAIIGGVAGAGGGAILGGLAGHEISKHGAPMYSRLTPQSSNVKGWSYDPKNQDLVVTFKGGGTYRYLGVPPSVARAMGRNKSVGKTIHRSIKGGGYEYEKVSAKLAKSYTCKFCKEKATKGVLWAEGRAIVPACDAHLAKAKGSVDEIDAIRDLTKTATGDLVKSPENRAAFLRERAREGGAKKASMVKEAPKKRIPPFPKGLSAKERFVMSRGGSMKKTARISDWLSSEAEKAAGEAARPDLAVGLMAGFTERRRQIAKMAGVAKKQISWQGLTMKLEYLKGDERSGVNGATGKKWSRTMRDHYGYMPGTYGKGADGDAIDIYFNPDAGDEVVKNVYKIRQKKKTGEYDEDKFMVGYASADEAKKAFLRNMPEWAFGSMTGVSMEAFKRLVGQSKREAA
jgi:hypothetical protein